MCDFGQLDEQQRRALFAGIPAGEIWEVGPRITEKLLSLNIKTVEDLRCANLEMIRKQFSAVLARTVNELNGIPCIELEDASTPRQQIVVSRSFGASVTGLADLSESVAYFAIPAQQKNSGMMAL
ncbi:MAG: hypothetical protein WA435_14555 [Gallionellaceae bacterium]